MNASTSSEGVAVICDRAGPHADLMAAHLQVQGIADAQWYHPREADHADKALRAGRVRRIIFWRLDDFLAALWDGALAAEDWLNSGARVEFAEPPGLDAQAQVTTILASWVRWRRRRRLEQAIAGLILGVVAVLAAFGLLLLATG